MQAFDQILFFGQRDRFAAYCLHLKDDATGDVTPTLVVVDAKQRDDADKPKAIYEKDLAEVEDINFVINDVLEKHPEAFPSDSY